LIQSLLAHHPGALGPINHLGPQQIAAVAAAALLDAMNPTALGVLLLILWQGGQSGRPVKRAAFYYIAGIMTTYLVAGNLLRNVYLNYGPSLAVQGIQTLLALFLFISGLNELLAAIKPQSKRLIEVPDSINRWLNKFTGWMENGFAFPVGMAIGFIELFATGAIYLTFVQAITYDPTAPWWVLMTMMVIYLTVFILPLVVIILYQPLVGMLADASDQSTRARIARGILGALFMAAACFIAASAYVTVASSTNFWWF
jgi:hypothetical protein